MHNWPACLNSRLGCGRSHVSAKESAAYIDSPLLSRRGGTFESFGSNLNGVSSMPRMECASGVSLHRLAGSAAALGLLVVFVISSAIAEQDGRKPVLSTGNEAAANVSEARPESLEKEEKEPGSFPVDVSDLFEVTVHGRLKRVGTQKYSIAVSLQNISEDTVPGPILVVVPTDLGIEGLSHSNSQGLVITGESFVEVLDEKKSVKPNRKTRRVAIEFSYVPPVTADGPAVARLTPIEVIEFDPEFLVRRDKPEPIGKARLHPNDEKLMAGKSYSMAQYRRVLRVQDRITDRFLKNEEVMGTATAEDANGNLVIEVFTTRAGVAKDLPEFVEGIPVKVEPTGPISAGPLGPRPNELVEKKPLEPVKDAFADTGVETFNSNQTDPRQRIRPAGIGSSTSNIASGCLSGTLGFRATNAAGLKVVVSNWHVWARGGRAEDGEGVLQPSRGDSNCSRNTANIVGRMDDFEPITFDGSSNVIDAASAIMEPGTIVARTPGNGYGFPSTTPALPLPGMLVQKYGRTTQYTHGRVFAVNAAIRVQYGSGRVATFRRQIGILPVEGEARFSAGGDSGSFVVTEPDRRPLGLLFAGGGNQTFANPIQDVLTKFNITVDGESSDDPPPGDDEDPDPETAKVGDLIWMDANRNGIKDPTESGVADVSIQLFSAGDDGEVGGGDDADEGTVTTDDGGRYEFASLPEGRYYLEIKLPDNKGLTRKDIGNSDAHDSDFDPASGRTAVFNLAREQEDLSQDGGLVDEVDEGSGRIGNFVFFDRNRNGRRNRREPGVAGVSVELYLVGEDGQSGTSDDEFIGQARTNRRGFYQFRNLSEGNYFLKFTAPSGRALTYKDVGRDNRDSDADPQTGLTDSFFLQKSTYDPTRDAGLIIAN